MDDFKTDILTSYGKQIFSISFDHSLEEAIDWWLIDCEFDILVIVTATKFLRDRNDTRITYVCLSKESGNGFEKR